MVHVVCYSGGHSSGICGIEVCRRFGKHNTVLLNHDISLRSEQKDIKRFKQEVADYLGMKITYANMVGWEKKDQFDVVIEAGAFKVGSGTALCSNRMKLKPFEKWLGDNFPTGQGCIIYYGFDRYERSRIQRRSGLLAAKGFKTDFPLALWNNRTIQATEELGIRRPTIYKVFNHANCIGCLKAGKRHWYVVYCLYPTVWERAKYAEDEIGYSIFDGMYLDELEPLFVKMKNAGVVASEKMPSSQFWKSARRRVADKGSWCGFDLMDDDTVPCECVG